MHVDVSFCRRLFSNIDFGVILFEFENNYLASTGSRLHSAGVYYPRAAYLAMETYFVATYRSE